MDEAPVEALGAKPLAADLAAIKAEKTRPTSPALWAVRSTVFGGSVFGASVQVDGKDPDHYAVYLSQAGLGLPDRDYYLEPSFAPQKAKYQAYVAQMLTLAGWPDPAANAKAIVALETEIAEASWTRAEQRDDDKIYNPMTTAEAGRARAGLRLAAFLAGAGLAKADRRGRRRRTPPSRRSPRSSPRRRSRR